MLFKKFKKYYFFILIISNHLIKSQSLADNIDSRLIKHFLKQPKYSESSITCFLKHTYNNSYYAEKFLALNFSHLISLLEYSKNSKFPRRYIYNILTLFNQKISETYYINNYAFLDFLEKLNLLLSPYFDQEKEKKNKISLINKKLYELLTDNFINLKDSPEKVLNETSISIYNIFQPNKDSDLSIYDIKLELNLLLLNIILKLIWNPAEQIQAWKSFKFIAEYLVEITESNILDAESTDQLIWHLISRFSYFLINAGEFLNQDTYQEIRKDLKDENLFLYKYNEIEPFIKTKSQYFIEILDKAEIKAKIANSNIL